MASSMTPGSGTCSSRCCSLGGVGTTSEQSPSTGAKVRGALPGDSWREFVSEGAQKAYDGPLSGQREEAHKLARKGRLVAAHKREKASYKIRVRGYARQRSAATNKELAREVVDKAYTSRSFTAGPVKYASKKLQLRKPTKGEERAEQLRALLGGVGTVKLAAGAGAGALVTDAVKDARDKSQKATRAVKDKIKPEETKVTKTDEPRSLVEIRKDWEEISKGPIGWVKGLGAKALSRVTSPITEPLKKKAKKYTMYGAAGAAGTVAAGTAVGTAAGNTVSPRR